MLSDYELRELNRANREAHEIERAPLTDRKEGAQTYFEVMRDDPARVAERIAWLINGEYGQGQMLKAKQIVSSPRMNRVAALSGLIAIYEFRTSQVMAIAAWKKLTKPQQTLLNKAIEVVIAAAEAYLTAEG
jgi:hypothetical protein